MKVATWNVNGIRARASQVREWLERERPDVVCLQELKAESSQIPEESHVPEYHAYWHGRKGYSGVSLQVRKELFAVDPVYSHPPFDFESRIVQVEHGDLVIASVYVPNGGKDYAAKLEFVTRLTDWARRLHAEGRSLLVCGDLNIARTEMDVHPRSASPTGWANGPRSGRCSRRCSVPAWPTWGACSTPTIQGSSPGGRRGVISVPATSAGASTTCWRHRPSRLAPRAAWCGPTSARVITRRW